MSIEYQLPTFSFIFSFQHEAKHKIHLKLHTGSSFHCEQRLEELYLHSMKIKQFGLRERDMYAHTVTTSMDH